MQVKAIFFASKSETDTTKNLRSELDHADLKFLTLDTHDPIQSQLCIADAIRSLQSSAFERLVVDITTFRREELLILLNELRQFEEDVLKSTIFLYAKAGSMANWLSGSIREVRSVIGYPGEIDSLKKNHLILMSGIELNRAKAIIEAYEPFSVSLGMVPEDESLLPQLFEKNLELRNFLTRHFDQIRSEFDFSATNPSSVKAILRSLLVNLSEYNVILAPLNTKISTLAAGVVAQENPRVQLCYAEVDVYNVESYSTVGRDVLLLQYSDLYH